MQQASAPETRRRGPRVLITGVSGGIGGAAAEQLRARGARVIGLDLHGTDADTIPCDVRDEDDVQRAVATAIDRLGGLDVVINAAGIGTPKSATQAP